eukprot:gene8933-12048_t
MADHVASSGSYKHHLSIRQSTLLRPTKNVVLHRIRPETKIKVEQDTKSIENEMKRNNLLSRKRFKREENERLRKNAESREKMIKNWQIKTADSPFRWDLVDLEEKRNYYQKEHDLNRANRIARNNILSGMIGTPKDDICPPSKFKSFPDYEVQLSLELRKHRRNLRAITYEKKLLEDMVDNELDSLYSKFPKLAMDIAFNQHARAGTSTPVTDSFFGNSSIDSSSLMTSSQTAPSSIHLTSAALISKPRYSPEEVKRIKQKDGVYNALGRYIITGEFIEAKDLRATLPSPKYAQASIT